MNNISFTTTFLVDQSPEQVYNAINNVRGWWSENIEGSTDTLNSEFYYHYKDVHETNVRIVVLVPAKKVVWHVLENYFSFTKDKSEWKDTKIIFDIAKKDDKTEVTFTHEGLVPQYECYEVCNEAWTHYMRDSLQALIATGKGQPSPKEQEEVFNSHLMEKWNLNQ